MQVFLRRDELHNYSDIRRSLPFVKLLAKHLSRVDPCIIALAESARDSVTGYRLGNDRLSMCCQAKSEYRLSFSFIFVTNDGSDHEASVITM
jgi:hypothetical protein